MRSRAHVSPVDSASSLGDVATTAPDGVVGHPGAGHDVHAFVDRHTEQKVPIECARRAALDPER
jgi:pantoate kinase